MRMSEFAWSDAARGVPSGRRSAPGSTIGTLVALGVVGGFAAAAAVVPAASVATVAVHAARAGWDSLPADAPAPALPGRTTMVDRSGRVVAQVFTVDRTPVTGDRQAPIIRQAVVATEDANFYRHAGVDVRGLARAALSLQGDGQVQGGSTITQQYVKNLRIAAAVSAGGGSASESEVARATAVSIGRKLEEAKMALGLERRMSKEDILTGYLNVAYFGKGAFGVQAAAQRYFSIDAADLTLEQAAMLAGLLRAPSRYDPMARPALVSERRAQVLSRMRETGVIDRAQEVAAAAKPLGLTPSSPRQGCRAAKPEWAHVCDTAIREIKAAGWLGPDRAALLGAGGMTIRLTVDPGTQQKANRTAVKVIPRDHRVANAIALVEPGSGRVLALGTNRRFGIGGGRTEVPLATAPRFAPGSTFKIFTLTAALEAGVPLDTTLPAGNEYFSDEFDNPPGGYHNAEGLTGSNVTIPEATERSLNTAFVQLEEQVGVAAVASAARRLGIRSIPAPGHKGAPGKREGTFTLGMRDVSVLDMAGAYAAVAAHGWWCPPHIVDSVTLPSGAVIAHPDSTCRQAVSAPVADSVASVLAGVIRKGTGRNAALPGGRPAAGKTGTAEDAGAAWFAGFTPQAAAAVWTGDPRSPRYTLHDVLGLPTVYGGTLPADLWRDLMAVYHRGRPVVKLPSVDPAYLLGLGAVDPDAATVPDTTGQDVDLAAQRLRAAGFDVSIETAAERSYVRSRTVVAQAPKAGAVVHRGSRVKLQVTP